jgi:hypothetical protein
MARVVEAKKLVGVNLGGWARAAVRVPKVTRYEIRKNEP